jgi:probable O-glycosylation ligase (exosortase A-associated)
VHADGWTWGSIPAVWAESEDRVLVFMRGEKPAMKDVPERGDIKGRALGLLEGIREQVQRQSRFDEHALMVFDRRGRLIDSWGQHKNLFTDGGAHRIQISPYDSERHVWLVEHLSHQILKFTNDGSKLQTLIMVMVLSLGLEGAKQGWAELFRNPGGRNDNFVAFLGDNNGVAVGMLMLVPLLSALARTTRRPWLRRFYVVILLGIVYRALSTYSRGGFLAAGVLAMVYWFRSRRKIATLIGTLVVCGILLPVMPDAFWDRMRTIRTYSETEEESAVSRLHFWKVAAVMAKDNPVFGVGFQAFNSAYDEYDFSFGRYGEGRSVHSSWFGVLSELGYPGFILYVLVLGLGIRNCMVSRRLCAKKADQAHLVTHATAIETSLWVFTTGSTFLASQYNEMLYHIVGLSIALRLIAQKTSRNTQGGEPLVPSLDDRGGAR